MGVEDIEDLLTVCLVTSRCTPDCLQTIYHCDIFGSNLEQTADVSLSRILCLPVPVKELYQRVINLQAPAVCI